MQKRITTSGLCYAYQAIGRGDPRQEPDAELISAALTALEKAVDLSLAVTGDLQPVQPPFLTETYYLIGELQAGQGDFNAAEEAYLSSGLPKAYHALAQLSAKVGSSGLETARRLRTRSD